MTAKHPYRLGRVRARVCGWCATEGGMAATLIVRAALKAKLLPEGVDDYLHSKCANEVRAELIKLESKEEDRNDS